MQVERLVRSWSLRARGFACVVSVALVALSAGSAAAADSTPSVSGPITGGAGKIVPPNVVSLDLNKVGYRQSEYFLSGTASAYAPNPAPLTSDGRWTVAATSTAPYTTRIVVFRPKQAAKFNGTVVVEWLNVSGQVDANPDWTMTHNELIRDGFAWAGVSAQPVGVNQLQCPSTLPDAPVAPCANAPGDPVRYGSLSNPGDSYSYDIFSQAGQAIRDDSAKILSGLKPKKVLAVGESQSAGRMVTYIDAVQPVAHVYDGFLVHSRSGGAAPLSQPPLAAVTAPTPTLIRTDLDVPVFVFQTESDVVGGFAARQEDTNMYRAWEAAGTSHYDHYGLSIGPTDIGDGQGAVTNMEGLENPTDVPSEGGKCATPINTGGAHWLLNAAIYRLNQWVTKGTPPPKATPLQIASMSPFAYAKDANGTALGGARTPQVDAPIATLGGVTNSAAPGHTDVVSTFCRLFGSTVPYTSDQLAALYQNHQAFVSAWTRATQKLVKEGFVLKADEKELVKSAKQSTVGK
jgi:Alpha/beta hydrolase domain